MNKNWPVITTEMSAAVKELRAGAPNVMKEFSALARAALEPKALDSKTKELIALAISVAVRCDPCIAFHNPRSNKERPATKSWRPWEWRSIWVLARRSCMPRKRSRLTTNSRFQRRLNNALPGHSARSKRRFADWSPVVIFGLN